MLKLSKYKLLILLVLCLPLFVLAQEETAEDKLEEFLIQFHSAKSNSQKIALFHSSIESIRKLENADTVSSLLKGIYLDASQSNDPELHSASIEALFKWLGRILQYELIINLSDSILLNDRKITVIDSIFIYDVLAGVYCESELYDVGFDYILLRNDLINNLDSNEIKKTSSFRYKDINTLYYVSGLYHEYIAWNNNYIKEIAGTVNEKWIPNYYNNNGFACLKLFEPDSALYYFNIAKQMLSINLPGNDSLFLVMVIGNIGSALIMKGEYERAVPLLLNEINHLKRRKDPLTYRNMVSGQLSLAECYRLMGKPIRANNMLDSAWHYIQLMKYNQPIAKYILTKSKVLNDLGQYDLAYSFSDRYINYNDSVEKAKEYANSMSMRVAFDTKQKEHLISQQKKQLVNEKAKAEQNRERAQKQKYYFYFLLIGLGSILIILIVIFRSRQKQKRINMLLEQQNEKISTQAAKLKTTNSKLEELDKFKETMTSLIAHDLKNPLSTIIGLSDKAANIEQRQIKQAGTNMLNLVTNLLDVNKYENTNMPLKVRSCQVRELANSAINRVSLIAENKFIEIINQVPEDIFVGADVETLERVFENLLSNAIKYSPLNGKILILATSDEQDWVKFKVLDEGEGIDDKNIDKLFDKYYQADAKNSGEARSFGLGLAFCKMAIEAHGGSIGAEPNRGKGAEFWFTLNRIKSEDFISTKLQQVDEGQTPIIFSESERGQLETIIQQLKDIDYYEVSLILKILNQVDKFESENILSWRKRLMRAIDAANKEKYIELLNI